MPIIKANESMPKRPVVMVIYGMPGAGKSSLCNTAKNPLLVDCDRGADRAIHRQDTLTCNSWEDVIKEIDNFKDYDTICIDTCRALLDDFLADYVKRKDDICKRNQLKMYGAMGVEFKEFVSKIRSMEKDLVLIAHAKDEKDGDITKFSPDVTGGSKELILRIADQVGFLCVVNGVRTIRWEPTERTVGKNVAGLPKEGYSFPNADEKGFDTCLADIIEITKGAIQKRSNAQNDALKAIEDAESAIAAVKTPEDALKARKLVLATPKANQKPLADKLKSATDAAGLTYDKDQKVYVQGKGDNA